MKKTIYFFTFIFVCLLGSFSLSAQTGQYNLHAVTDCSDVDAGEFAVKFYLQATATSGDFNASEINIRFSFTRDIIANPVADATGGLEEGAYVDLNNGGEVSWYGPQTVTGSADTIVSYNLELQYGDGVLLSNDYWTYVGQVKFDLLDDPGKTFIKIHDHSVFPSTFIGEKYNNALYEAEEGQYFVTYSPECPCNEPTGVVVTNVKPMSAMASWDFNASATHYEITHGYYSGGTYHWNYYTANGDETSFDLTGLVPGTQNVFVLNKFCGSAYAGNDFYVFWTPAAIGGGSSINRLGGEDAPFENNPTLVFPNPAKDMVTVAGLRDNDEHIQIMDLSGRVIREIPVTGSGEQINVSDLTTGLYGIRIVSTDGKVRTEKLMKQ